MEKKLFNNGIVKPAKMRRCNKCKGKILCMTSINQVNENEEFEAFLNFLWRQAPIHFGHLLLILKNKMINVLEIVTVISFIHLNIMFNLQILLILKYLI